MVMRLICYNLYRLSQIVNPKPQLIFHDISDILLDDDIQFNDDGAVISDNSDNESDYIPDMEKYRIQHLNREYDTGPQSQPQ